MLCVRALVRALNDAKNRAQRGCAMQFSGITLSLPLLSPFQASLRRHCILMFLKAKEVFAVIYHIVT